jgi:hypothetical protein
MQQKRISGVIQKQLKDQLKQAVAEKDVEAAYKDVFKRYYQTTFPSPYGSDGFIEQKQLDLLNKDTNLRLLLEVKFQQDLSKSNGRAKIVAQSIYYLKKFELDSMALPNVIVGGDENQLFTIYAPKLYEYLERDYDWNIAPSSAWQENVDLYRELIEDPNLNVYVFDVMSSSFDINEVFDNVNALSRNTEFKKIRVSEANLRAVFDEFVRVVFGEKWVVDAKRKDISAELMVAIFIQSILGDPDIFLVPTKKNILQLSDKKQINVNGGNYDAFFSRYDRKYSVDERDKITAVADQLIEEVRRRFHGDFWTPTIWANRAIRMMDEDLGEGWREKYIVWDPAAGTKNLTRDYRFKNLFSSTIHQSEIEMSKHYNKESTAFQYDFLNDDIDINPATDPKTIKMPTELFNALKEKKPIIFYTNPPYGQATDQGETSKKDIANNKVGDLMSGMGFGHASAELYTQFIFRVQKLATDFELKDVYIFFFTKGFLTSPAFEKFTDNLLSQFEFQKGFMLNAGEFQGTSSNWGIIFSNFRLKSYKSKIRGSFNFSIEKSPSINDTTQLVGTHILRKISKNDTISAWLSEKVVSRREFKGGSYPRLTGGFNVSTTDKPSGYYREDAFGFLHNNGQNVQYSDKYVNLNSSMNSADHGSSVTKNNFERVCVTFASRKSVLPDASWINDKDIFRRPSEVFQSSKEWTEFELDCIVYSLFHRSSYQTSLRNFVYKDREYDVTNEWFFMSKNEVIALADKNNLSDIVYDARSSEERFIYKYLSDKNLSSEATSLLEAGKELVRSTFKKRFIASQEHPEWHLMAWDAGYYQAYKIATMFKNEFETQMTLLEDARLKLETKIRGQVYKDKILEK